VYVHTGPVRRLPKGPPWPGHGPDSLVHNQVTGELHWLNHDAKGVVHCAVCGPIGRKRRLDRMRRRLDPVQWWFLFAATLSALSFILEALGVPFP
jgi:hypothetical protein